MRRMAGVPAPTRSGSTPQRASCSTPARIGAWVDGVSVLSGGAVHEGHEHRPWPATSPSTHQRLGLRRRRRHGGLRFCSCHVLDDVSGGSPVGGGNDRAGAAAGEEMPDDGARRVVRRRSSRSRGGAGIAVRRRRGPVPPDGTALPDLAVRLQHRQPKPGVVGRYPVARTTLPIPSATRSMRSGVGRRGTGSGRSAAQTSSPRCAAST